MSAVGGNYISDGAIMAWLAQQQDRIYTDLKDSMDMSERRADFQSALTNIETKLAEANGSKDFSEVDRMLQALMETYESEPQFADVCEQLRPMANQIHDDWNYKANVYPELKANYDAATREASETMAGTSGGRGGSAALQNSAVAAQNPKKPVDSYSDEDLEAWQNTLGGQVDNLGRNDQLTMIHIQELKATLDQGSQLASTFISSGDKTSSAIINNIA